MLQTLNDFDSISFLGINTESFSPEQATVLRISLNDKIGEYILLKFTKSLNNEQIDHITSLSDGNQILSELSKIVPNFEQKMSQELDNFKKEYQTTN